MITIQERKKQLKGCSKNQLIAKVIGTEMLLQEMINDGVNVSQYAEKVRDVK